VQRLRQVDRETHLGLVRVVLPRLSTLWLLNRLNVLGVQPSDNK
jgi:hypothetical protein